jgi:Zn-dependent peptidase ImmA (M78 family)/DNA-binding XRE family transcriptional regulator
MMKQVNRKMIEIARLSRGLSQKDLAEKLGIEQGTLSKIENEELSIRYELIKSIALHLKYPIDFFSEDIKMLSPLVVHYRKRKSIDNVGRAFVESNLYIRKHIIKKLLKAIDLPNKVYDLNPYLYESPENAARMLRQKWFVSKGPIKNLVELVEAAGILVLHTESNNPKLMGELLPDEHGVKVIYINKDMSVDRQRYTLAHELGHLMMHSGEYMPNIEDAEKEADRFAGEFLMPEYEIKPSLYLHLSISQLGDLKRYWKCSMSSIIMRAHATGAIDHDSKTILFKQMSSAGYNKAEPSFGIVFESPILMHQLIRLHLNDLEYTEQELADFLKLYPTEVNNLVEFYSPNKMKAVVKNIA